MISEQLDALSSLAPSVQMHPTADDMLDAIIKLLAPLPAQLRGQGDGRWTAAILETVRQLGKSFRYEVCPDNEDLSGEWLYDLVWYRNNEADQIVDIPLVLESEWSRHWGRIRYDFEKLVQAKAGLKVMVFQADGDELNELYGKLLASIQAFGRGASAERYLFAAFQESEYAFAFRVIHDASIPKLEHLPLIVADSFPMPMSATRVGEETSVPSMIPT